MLKPEPLPWTRRRATCVTGRCTECAKCGEVARSRATPPVAPAAHIDEVMVADCICDRPAAPKFLMLQCKKPVLRPYPEPVEKSSKCRNLRSAGGRLVAVVSQNVPLL